MQQASETINGKGKNKTTTDKSPAVTTNNNNNNNQINQRQDKVLYVPEAPEGLKPIQPITKRSEKYEAARLKQLEVERVVETLYAANQLDESIIKYTQVCQ